MRRRATPSVVLPAAAPAGYFPAVTRRALCCLASAFALLVPASTVPAQATGSYLAMKIDQSPLPLSDKVTDSDGTTYLVEFERLVLSLRPGNRFRASVRFKRSHTGSDKRAGSRQAPIQSMTVSGTYAVLAGEITFKPDSSGDGKGLKMLAGRVEGPKSISVPFDYRNGLVERRRVLHLTLRNDIL